MSAASCVPVSCCHRLLQRVWRTAAWRESDDGREQHCRMKEERVERERHLRCSSLMTVAVAAVVFVSHWMPAETLSCWLHSGRRDPDCCRRRRSDSEARRPCDQGDRRQRKTQGEEDNVKAGYVHEHVIQLRLLGVFCLSVAAARSVPLLSFDRTTVRPRGSCECCCYSAILLSPTSPVVRPCPFPSPVLSRCVLCG